MITIEDGSIHLYKHAREGSDVVMGYIATEKEYGDYHLRLQYRWGTKKFQPRYQLKRDAGLYYHIIGPDAVWPTALQFQIEETNVGDLIALYGMTVDTWIDPEDARERTAGLPRPEARRPGARPGRARHRLPETPGRRVGIAGMEYRRSDRPRRHDGPSPQWPCRQPRSEGPLS